MNPIPETDRFYQHDIMCCDLKALGSKQLCRTCNKLKRKIPSDQSLCREKEQLCVLCRVWMSQTLMRKNVQYLQGYDHVCKACFFQLGPYRGVKGKQEHSLRTVRFNMDGELRRCSQLKHWIPVLEMMPNPKFCDGIGVTCKTCVRQGIKRKLNKSQRKHLFGGRKIKQQELKAQGVTVNRFE